MEAYNAKIQEKKDRLNEIDRMIGDEDKCLVCMTYAEAGGAPFECQQAVLWSIKNRKGHPDFQGQTDYCEVVSAKGQFQAYTDSTNRYPKCINENLDPLEEESKNRIEELAEQSCDINDPTGGITFFIDNSIPTEPWMQDHINQGLKSKVKIDGCDSMTFYKINN